MMACGRRPASSFLILLFSLRISAVLGATPDQCDVRTTKHSVTNRQSFFEVLQQVGKTIFRPGGSEATQRLLKWADFPKHPSNNTVESFRVLYMAGGVGGLDLAADNGCHVLVVDQDKKKLRKIEKLARKRGLAKFVTTKSIDLSCERLNTEGTFDVAIFEASLSQYPDSVKRQIVKDLYKSKTHQILLHELGLRNVDEKTAEETSRKVGQALGLPNFAPLTIRGWESLLTECGYRISNEETGPLLTLSPKTMLKDEGPSGVARIGWNLATHGELRNRVISTKAVLASHNDTLGYILIRAVPEL